MAVDFEKDRKIKSWNFILAKVTHENQIGDTLKQDVW